VLGVLLVGMTGLAYIAWRERERATMNFGMARAAVDQTLSSVDVDPVRAGADVPQMAELRRGLLERAKRFSMAFLEQDSRGAELRQEAALAHLRLGHISRMMNDPAGAEREYRKAIEQFDALEADAASPAYRAGAADAYNWIGETLRGVPGRTQDAAAAYERALAIQTALVAADSGNADYRQQLARTHGNRGILRASAPDAPPAQLAGAEADLREALRLLEPLAAANAPAAAQELSRTANNLAALVAEDETRLGEAAALYDRAIRTHETLVAQEPGNRVYKLELAKFCENDADLARTTGDLTRATRRNQQALALLDELLLPAPSLGIEHADAHSLRGRILADAGSPDAAAAYAESLRLFDELDRDPAARRQPAFHQRYGDLLLNLAALSRDSGADGRSHRLLAQAVTRYAAHADASLAAGDRSDAQLVADNLSGLLPELGDADRRAVGPLIDRVRARLTPPK
jgi:tetratricopeptide (TPR) repeat protein